MGKSIIYLAIIVIVAVLQVSCNKVLDVKPENIVSSSEAFSTKKSVKFALSTTYDESAFSLESFGYGPGGSNRFLPIMTGLFAESNYSLSTVYSGNGKRLGWWKDGYKSIRHVNNFIANVKKSDYSKELKNQWLGEALFLRANDYFGLVKRYGGVPLVTKVQTYETGDDISKLRIPRKTEKEIYDFISTQLDSAIALMGPASPEKGRANKFVALALKSRAMSFAASVAEYGSVQLNGLAGIPSKYADSYWKQTYNAAWKIINSGQYSLYDKYPDDPSENYQQLFLHAKDNPEVILAKYYKYPQKTHNWDLWVLPYEYRSPLTYSSMVAPSLQLVEAYNYKDGSDGKLKIENSQGKRIEYKNPLDLFKNKDPRLSATVILPFSKWRDQVVHVRKGIIDNGKTITSNSHSATHKGMPIMGANGPGGNVGDITGFNTRKYLDPEDPPSEVTPSSSDQPWIVFRLGGILLNYAEAAVELGRNDDAARAINKIRARADMPTLSSSEVTVHTVRHERKVEMPVENTYYWDMKRWRIADKVLNNYKNKALYPFYVLQDKAYVFKVAKVGYAYHFLPKIYYLKIPEDVISKNPKLTQNPGY